MNEVLIGMTARKRLPELLHGPVLRRVGGRVVVEHSASAQFHDHEYIQGAEGGSDHNEEVTGHHQLSMVADESQPTLLGIGRAYRSTRAQVLSHSAGRYSNPE